MVDAMEVHLVSLELWEEYEREVWKQEGITPDQIADIDHEDRKLERVQDSKILAAIQARQTVGEFHNRHIGLTCGLAYRLVRVLQKPLQKHEAARPWNDVLERLDSELVSKDSSSTGVGQVPLQGGILLNEAPVYSVYRLVMPLVQVACQAIGECFLAADNVDGGSSYTVADLIQYENRLITKIDQLAKDQKKPELRLFWIDRAVALAAYSRRPSPMQLLPDPDALSAALFYRLDAMPETLREYENLQRVPVRFRQQHARRLREEGLSGIVLSRSLEDIDRMLLSELIYPPLLRADRLLNTGYLVTERRPRQEKLRDALIVGFLPPHTGDLASRAFVKTCWFNAMMVLAQVLFRHRLFDSEFWWIEGDTLERYSAAVFPLSHLKTALKARNQIQVLGHPQFRNMFLNLTRWQPGYLDPDKPWLGGPVSLDMPQPTEVDVGREVGLSGVSLPARWILTTALTQHLAAPSDGKDLQEARMASSLSSSTLVEMISGFAMVHFSTFLPAEMLEQEEDNPWGQETAALLKFGLRLVSSPLHNLSISWLAATGQSRRRQPPPVLCYLGRFYRQKFAWDAAVPEGDLHTLASRLEKIWLDEIVRELQGDF